jgi:YHS domain-containing protein
MRLLTCGAFLMLIAGCASQPEPTATLTNNTAPSSTTAQTAPVKLTTQQELAKYCRVCVVDKGEKIEEFFPSRLDTKKNGQTYKFCTDNCKKAFDAEPKKYLLP